MNTQDLRTLTVIASLALFACGAPETGSKVELVVSAGGAVRHRVDLTGQDDLIEEVGAFERFVGARGEVGRCEAPATEVGLELENRGTLLCGSIERVDEYVQRLESKLASRASLESEGLAESEAALSAACSACRRGSEFGCCVCGGGGSVCLILLL